MASTAAILDILVRANTAQATAALTKVDRQMKATAATANTASNSIGNRLGKAAKYTGAAVGGGLAYGMYKSIQVGMDFEKQMDSLGAVAKSTGREMEQLREQALKLGQDTAYSASQVGQAQAELVKGGIKVKDVLGGAVPAALNLAAAGEVELGVAAETTANAMQLFSLRGKDAGHIADLLATAANKTTADVEDFAMALKQGGGVAKLAGYDINQTVTALEALATAGYKNSDAGTSLKAAFVQLLKPTEKQAALTEQLGLNFITQNGQMKDAAAIAQQLQGATEGMTQAERAKTFAVLAGTDGVRTLQALYDAGPAVLEKYAAANEKVGTAQQIAKDKMDNTAGSLEQLKGSLETFGIRVFDAIGPTFREMVDGATEVVTEFTDVISDKRLTQDQKFDEIAKIIDRELGKIIPDLQKMVEKALPIVAEMGAKIGLALTKALVKAWWESDLLGKLFMTAVLVKALGGWKLIEASGKAVGMRFGKGMGKGAAIGLVAGLVLLVPEMAKWLSDHRYEIRRIGVDVGNLIANGVIDTINGLLNTLGDDSGPLGGAVGQALSSLGVPLADLPDIEIPEIKWDPSWSHAPEKIGKTEVALSELLGQAGKTGRGLSGMDFGKAEQGLDEVRGGTRKGERALGDYLDAWGDATRGANRDAGRHATVLSQAMRSVGTDLNGGGDDLRGYISTLAQQFGRGKDNTRDFTSTVGSWFPGLSATIGSALGTIGDNTNSVLGSLGADKLQFALKVAKDPNGKSLGRQTGGLVPGFRTGSLVPGIGSGDKVPLHLGGQLAAMVEPGELVSVANRNATAALMAANSAVPRFASGGVIQQALGPYDMPPISYDPNHAGGNSHLHLDFFTVAQALAYGHKMQQMGWSIDEYTPKGGNPWGFGGISASHQSPGHYDGTAFDANTASDETQAEVAAVVRMLGGKGIAGAVVEKIKRVLIEGPEGPMRDLAQSASDKVWKAANAYLATKNPAGEVGVGGYTSGGSGDVVTQMGRVMLAKGMNPIAAAGAIGNSYGESHWKPTAMEPGTDNGGLFGFTSGEKSLASLRAYAEKVGQPWSDVGTQVSFMFTTLGSILGMMNSAGSTDESTRIFMDEWERPAAWAAAQSIGTRQAAARRVYPEMVAMAKSGGAAKKMGGGIVAKLAKGGFLDPFIDRVYGAKDTKKQTAAEIRKATAKNAARQLEALKTKGLSFDRDSAISGKLLELQNQAAMYGEYADNATDGTFRGLTEAEWATKQLDSLWAFRQMLARVEVKVKERQEQAEKIAKRARKQLKVWDSKLIDAKAKLAKDGETPKGWKGDDPTKVSAEKWNKLAEKKRLDLAAKFFKAGGKLPGDRKFAEDGRLLTYEDNPGDFPNVKGMSAVTSLLKGTVIPRLVGSDGVIPALSADIKELASQFDTVQGMGLTHRVLKHGLPALGAADALGGEIFTVQSRLAELGAPTTSENNSELLSLLSEQLQETNRANALLRAQMPVFNSLPTFHTGGIVPGTGEQPAMVMGGEGVFTTEQMAAMGTGSVEVNLHFADGMEWLREFVHVEVKQVNRTAARRAERRQPSTV